MKIATSRYQNGKSIIDSGLAPIGITAGNPRFKLPYQMTGSLKILAPDRAWFDFPDDEFRDKMVAKLMRVGPTEITSEIARLSDGFPGAVLLCYEKVPPDFCHRTIVAEWLNTTLRIDVQEIPDLSPPSKPRGRQKSKAPVGPKAQGTLFEMPVTASARVLNKAKALVEGGRVHKGIGAYFVEPSTGPDMYTVVPDPTHPSCTCRWMTRPDGSFPDHVCSHILAARYVEEYGNAPAARVENGS